MLIRGGRLSITKQGAAPVVVRHRIVKFSLSISALRVADGHNEPHPVKILGMVVLCSSQARVTPCGRASGDNLNLRPHTLSTCLTPFTAFSFFTS